jgi:NADH-quinone oxidoreductase subunit L
MSGIKAVLPKTRWLMLIGCLALAGCPFLSGFFSKDEIVAAAWERHVLLGIVMLFTAFLTAYYTFRLYFRVFEGPLVVPGEPADGHGHAQDHHDEQASQARDAHADTEHAHAHNHEPALMIAPLVILAIGAIFAGYLNTHERFSDFLGKSPSLVQASAVVQHQLQGEPRTEAKGASDEAHAMLSNFGQVEPEAKGRSEVNTFHLQMMLWSGVIAAAGIGLAYFMHLHNRQLAERLAGRYRLVSLVLERKYYVDEIYDAIIVKPLRMLGHAFYTIDSLVVDGLVWLVGFIPQGTGFVLKLTTERGQLQGYALTMLLGIVVILIVVFAGLG